MSIDYDSLWNKTKTLLDRALRARDAEQSEDFQLWGAVALEILGKARLAKLHPALVVDPNSTDSLLVACGVSVTCDLRTIGAAAVFKRCQKTVDGFDKTCLDFSIALAEDRNADLHSGAIPFTGKDPEAWLNKYWTVVELLVAAQGRTLDELIGPDEAAAARTIIADARNTLAVGIERRIAKFAKLFAARPLDERNLRAAASKSLEDHLSRSGDDEDTTVQCPACKNAARLTGSLVHEVPGERVEEYDFEEDAPWVRWVDCTFAAEDLRCSACGLRLFGMEELDAAGIASDYEKTLIKEVDEGEPYGND